MTPFSFVRKGALSLIWLARSSVKMLRRARRSDAPDSNLLHLYAQELSRGWVRILNLNITMRNAERLTATQPCVFIANHQSNLDIPILAPVLPQKTVVIVKKELLKVPFLGRMIVAGQNIIIDRKNRADAHAGIGQAERAIRDSGISIWVFPEGTRNHGTPLPFKKGAFHLARNAGVKLVPIVHAVSPNWVDAKRLYVKQRPNVIVEILAPIDTADFASISECIQQTQLLMRNVQSRIEAEVAVM
ncbi:MAG TPA: lysophospholipid acyltransferase family protein [Thermoanaerobaculia bacterium]|nr:lysophospholipid acyltransferase family protein [Thermoanaerobaculia bacterium]